MLQYTTIRQQPLYNNGDILSRESIARIQRDTNC